MQKHLQSKLTLCGLYKTGSTRMHGGPFQAHGRLDMHGEVVKRARQLAPVPHPHAAILRACTQACQTRSGRLSPQQLMQCEAFRSAQRTMPTYLSAKLQRFSWTHFHCTSHIETAHAAHRHVRA